MMSAVELAWPCSPESLHLWSQLVFVWAVTNYGPIRDPVGRQEVLAMDPGETRRWQRRVGGRAVAGAVGLFLLVGPGLTATLVSSLFLALSLFLPELRRQCTIRVRDARVWELRAEYEISANAVFTAVSALLVGGRNLTPVLEADVASLPTGAATTVLVVASALVFLVRGGTHVVRGVLEKGDTLPAGTGSLESTLRHGLTIGNLERFLIFVFVTVGSWAAVGFVVAAKGIVRAVDWEGRESVEYFLIGTFASTALAIVTGLLVHALVL